MRTRSCLALILLSALWSSPATAQWFAYPTPGIPRSADGTPNLTAPAPRTREGKPDLSGIWLTPSGRWLNNLAADGVEVPFRPWALALYKERQANNGKGRPSERCISHGVTDFDALGTPTKIIQTLDVTVILFEAYNHYRQVFTDGRPLPKDPQPAWLGYSVGKWEGDTFTVDTIGLNDQTWLDDGGYPHSEGLKVTERFSRRDFGHSRRQGLVDRPGPRRQHPSPTPRTGGIAIALSYLVPVSILLVLPLNAADSVNLPLALSLLPAAFVVFITGLLDDLFGLKPWEKLLGQAAAACMAYAAGVHVNGVAGHMAPGLWSLPITVLWLVACANAFNLIDGVDGLASGVGLFAAFTTLAAALLQKNAALALATAPLVGALLAFLRYNFNPASIFLGDSGSLTIGFALGCFGAIWSQKSATLLGMTAPLMALSVPLLDTGLSVFRRFLRHEPIFRPDRNHIHHRLLARGLSPRQVALALYGVCGIAAAFSLLLTMTANRFDSLLLVGFCVAMWVGVQLVGYGEFDTARQLVVTGTFRHILNARLYVRTVEDRFGKVASADDYWEIVRDVGREFRCVHVRMSLMNRVYEHRDEVGSADRCCTVRIPLSPAGYVNFQYPADLAVRHVVALSSIVEILQRRLASSPPEHVVQAHRPRISLVTMPEMRGMRSAK